jgi:hypothetical protein
MDFKKYTYCLTANIATVLITGTVHGSVNEASMPEPGTLLLVGSGLVVVAFYRRFKKK